MRSNEEEDSPSVLVASPDVPFATVLMNHLAVERYDLEMCHDAKGVLRRVGRRIFDVVVLDVNLQDEAGVDLVSFIREKIPHARIILLFDIAKLEQALDGLRQGAFFYLPNSVPPGDVGMAVAKAVRSLHTENRAEHYEQSIMQELLGTSPAMQRVIDIIRKVSPTDSTVLLLGESGTGKDVLASTVHRLSQRRDNPFVAINCAALPETLLESELFGHVKGAFTGATADKRGLFVEADNGTIFLDEIGDMPLVTQAKLLRVLQNGEIRRVGDTRSQLVDVRVIAATNQDLVKAVREKRFREDLYFRLNVITVRIPPLRERQDSLPRLMSYFLQRANQKFSKHIQRIDDYAQALLRNYPYPGNVRELESIMTHAAIMAEGDVITAKDLPEQVHEGRANLLALPQEAVETHDEIPTLQDMEAELIRRALAKLDGNQTEAAQKLGISRSTLWRKMKEYDISA